MIDLPTAHLSDEFRDADTERALLAALTRAKPDAYWQVIDLLPEGAFAAEAAAWRALNDARQREVDPPTVPEDWTAAADTEAAAQRLADLYQRRLEADLLQQAATALHDPAHTAADVARVLQSGAAEIEAAVAETRAGILTTADGLAEQVVADAAARRKQREETGRPVTGILTGLTGLDKITSGWQAGLFALLAGGPGVGKTTLAANLARAAAAAGVPVLYFTGENSPANLVAKILCSLSGVPVRDIQTGYADVSALQRAARDHATTLQRIAVVEAIPGKTTIPVIRGRARQVMARFRTKQCLIVIDYLQLLARGGDYRSAEHRHNVSQFAADLRALAGALQSPMIALSSQSRQGGGYGTGGGVANNASLKESGDLEYDADLLMFIVPSTKRQCTPPARALDLCVTKQRDGDLGVVPLVFRPDIATMREEAKV